ncbi:MAG TPA: hypothetical protein VKM93_17990 [Terriglobia bacterium]|nr:hypothetical protein [Terriglobia bacterium]
MTLRFAVFFVAGFLGGAVACWARMHRLRAKLQLMEFSFRQRINTRLEQLPIPRGERSKVRPPTAA